MRPSHLAMDLTPLRESRDYRLVFAGFLGSLIGTLMTAVAVAVQVYDLTGSPLQLGLVSLARALPLVIGLLAGGVLADRMDRRRVMLLTRLPLALSAGALALNALLPDPHLWIIYLATALTGFFGGLGGPALLAAIPALVGTKNLAAAAALTSASVQIATLVGPALGGLLVAGPGLSTCYAVEAAGFLSFSLILLSVRGLPPTPTTKGLTQAFTSVLDGLRFVRRHRLIAALLLIDVAAMVFTMPQALYPALADQQFGGGPGIVGLLYAAPALGALIGAATSGWTGHFRASGYALIAGVLLWGLALTAFGLTSHLPLSLPLALNFLALAGLGDLISETLRSALLQHGTPDELRGRVSSLWLVQATVSPALGNAAVGLLAEATTPATAVTLGGLTCLTATLAVATAFPTLRQASLTTPGTPPQAAPV